MKTILSMLLLAAIPFYQSAQRTLEMTTTSWLEPNLSTETHKNVVFAGFTDIDPVTGLYSPTFKVTDFTGVPLNTFFINLNMDVTLMDFTIRPLTETLFLTGMTRTAPFQLFVVETDFAGNVLQSNLYPSLINTCSLIPHQIIHSEASQQVAIVGTRINGVLTPGNAASISKNGFVLALDLTNISTILISDLTDSPHGGVSDNDMLESLTEVPNGYFITGSANDALSGKQELYVLGVDFAGSTMHSTAWDDMGSRHCGSSVLYSPAAGVVYLAANNSIIHQFELAYFDPNTGALLSTNFKSHMITSLPVGSGIEVNGFRLRETNTHEIVIAGYINCSNPTILPNLLTPYQLTVDPTLTTPLLFKLFQSDNNFSSADYFTMTGPSIYINTPDVLAYNDTHDRTFVVNPNSNMQGYDLLVSHELQLLPCEEPLPSMLLTRTPLAIRYNDVASMPVFTAPLPSNPDKRTVKEQRLCPDKSLLIVSGVEIAPNPATDRVQVKLPTAIHDMTVIDLKGNKVISLAPAARSESAMIDISSLTPGMYVVLIADADGNTYRERFVKE